MRGQPFFGSRQAGSSIAAPFGNLERRLAVDNLTQSLRLPNQLEWFEGSDA
jgi:hypothetical protein